MRDAKEVDMLLHINKDSVQTLPLFFKDDVADVAEHCVCVWLRAGEKAVSSSLVVTPLRLFRCVRSCALRGELRCAQPNCVSGKPRTASVQFHSVRGSVCYVMSSGCYEIRMDCNDVFLTM